MEATRSVEFTPSAKERPIACGSNPLSGDPDVRVQIARFSMGVKTSWIQVNHIYADSGEVYATISFAGSPAALGLLCQMKEAAVVDINNGTSTFTLTANFTLDPPPLS